MPCKKWISNNNLAKNILFRYYINMKISAINSGINFKSNDGFVFGYDDSVSQNRRNQIREHYQTYSMPYQNIYEKEGRLGEYALNNLIGELAKKPKVTDYKSIMNLPAYNIRPISPNSYRGSTLADAPERCLHTLKQSGIDTVIDLVGYWNYEEKVKDAGMNYLYFPINQGVRHTVWDRAALQDNKNDIETREFIEDFINYIQTMQKGYVYIGCEFGKYQTDDALLLNNAFNPKAKRPLNIYNAPFKLDLMRNLYNNLTEDDKKRMGWDKEFDENFLPRIQKAEDDYAREMEKRYNYSKI